VWSHGEAELVEDDGDDPFSSLGCIWDQSGCAQGCNVEAMMGRCSQYDHDMSSCLGDDGQSARCQWGKYNERMLEKLDELKVANAEQEQEQFDDEEEEVFEEDEEDGEEDFEENDVLAETFVSDETVDGDDESVPVLDNADCVWDETGCVGSECSKVMGSRCSALTMLDCVGDLGAFKRCQQRARLQSEALFGLNVNALDSDMSTIDTVLVIGGMLTSFVVLLQGFRYCRQRTNKKLATREIQYGTIQLIDSHAEDEHV